MSQKVIVITGASGGIGAAIGERLGQTTHHQLVLVARRKKVLDSVVSKCGPKAAGMVADMERREDVRSVTQYALQQFTRIDVWINNVGRGITRPPSQLTDDDVDEMMRVNVKSALYGMQEVLPHFKARGDGHFINLSSMLARIPHAVHRSAYTASKFYLNALTAMMRDEVRQTHPNIVFSLVSPGAVATDFGNHAIHGGMDSRQMPDTQSADDVAAVVAAVIESRAPDVYTRPGSRDRVAAYYADIGADP